MTEATVLGTGVLSWPSTERIGDRYGVVMLMPDGTNSLSAEPEHYIPPTDVPVGQWGTLIAEVLETRDSTHIGDLFRGLFPHRPHVGERITLGTGRLFTETTRFGATAVGLEPDEPRDSDWLNPEALYRAHEQTVRLLFVAVERVTT